MNLLMWILFMHYVADFICQPDEIAKTKSKSLDALTAHIVIYGFVLFTGMLPVSALLNLSLYKVILWLGINCCAHFITDAFTSRAASRRLKLNDHHNFFVVIGADQFIHIATFILTMQFL